MEAVQLELNIENQSDSCLRLAEMQRQLDFMSESVGKVRRKLFSEMGEVKKMCVSLQEENRELKRMLRKLTNEKTEWIYGQNDCLFEVLEREQATG